MYGERSGKAGWENGGNHAFPAFRVSHPPLSTILSHERLSAETRCTDYLALSYCWGDHYPSEEIHIFNANSGATFPELVKNERRKIFKTRPNLFEALKRIRHPKDEITLWTDAICINQGDAEERSIQV